MHLDIYESIWLKLGMLLNTIELYILIQVSLILTFIQGHMSVRKLKL